MTAFPTDELTALLDLHVIDSGPVPKNLGQYRTAYRCECGEELITDLQADIDKRNAQAAHQAAVVKAWIDRQTREEWGVKYPQAVNLGYTERAHADYDAQHFGGELVRRRVTEWEAIKP
jgi:hypothetical protein